MKILVFTLTFPSRNLPVHGVFVKERMRHVAEFCEMKIVNPIPWFPFIGHIKKVKCINNN